MIDLYVLNNFESSYIHAIYELDMIHKIKYFDADKLEAGVFLQDIVNEFLAEKGDNVIAVHPVMEKILLVHYKED